MASKPSKRVGNDCDEGPPVPIPNTEVKLICADNTCRVTCREDRYCQHKHSSLAQSVEQRTVNPCVVGSSPTGGAIVNTHFRCQLRKVEFKVGIFYTGVNFDSKSSEFKGKMLTRFYLFS